jgi:hypothetical protein
VIGHPKGLTLYALEQLEYFIDDHQNIVEFATFSDLV